MSRRSTNFPPGIWQARREYDRQRYNRNDSTRMNSTPSHTHSFQVSGLTNSFVCNELYSNPTIKAYVVILRHDLQAVKQNY